MMAVLWVKWRVWILACLVGLLAAMPVAHAEEAAPTTAGVEATGTEKDLAYGAFQRGFYLTALELALPRANLGDPAAQTLIAEIYDRGLGVAKNPKEATAWYKIASNSGNKEAQFAYAMKLLEGKYVKRDREAAVELMRRAAEQGHAGASFNYAQQIIENRPGSKGFAEALPYLKQAAKFGVPDAYYALAKIYENGSGGIIVDPSEARYWLILAARSGVDTAQVELGIQLANGIGGDKDERSAFAWFQRAAEGGNVIGQNRLSRMYVLGLGTEADAVEAAKWYILARRAGHTDLWLDEFMASLNPSDRAKALEAANRWRSR